MIEFPVILLCILNYDGMKARLCPFIQPLHPRSTEFSHVLKLSESLDFLELGVWNPEITEEPAMLILLVIVWDKTEAPRKGLTRRIWQCSIYHGASDSEFAVEDGRIHTAALHLEGGFTASPGGRCGCQTHLEKAPMGQSIGAVSGKAPGHTWWIFRPC